MKENIAKSYYYANINVIVFHNIYIYINIVKSHFVLR